MTRASSPADLHRAPRRLAALCLLLPFSACGADTTPGAGTALTDRPGDDQGGTHGAPTTGSTGAAAASTAGSTSGSGTGEAASTSGVSGASTGATATTTGETSTTDVTTTTDTSSSGASSGDPEPPPPAGSCAQQDEPAPAVGEREAINDDPAFIQVYVNNVENLKQGGEQCPGDWTDLIYAMKKIEPSPDLFLVQQISDTAQLELLVERMNTDLPGIFEGVIADADPWTQLSPCGKEKAQQTNAVIFRKGRFAQIGDKHVWQSWANKNGECVRNNQARTRNVMLRLHDKIADRDISVASIHWSTSQGDGPDPACAEKNVLEADEKLHQDGFGGDLVIFGGDFNEPDRKDNGEPRPWFGAANGDAGGKLNYRDPIYRACQAAKGLQTCLDDAWTIGGERRIDMLFAQDGAGCRARSARAHTVTFNEAEAAAEALTGNSDPNLDYSDHRAVRAEFYY